MRKKLFFLVFIALLLLGCAVESTTQEAISSARTPTKAITETAQPTSTLDWYHRKKSVTPSITPTSTPTLSPKELEEKLLWLKKMFEGTKGCDFPCVADHAFVVGETSFNEAAENISEVYQVPFSRRDFYRLSTNIEGVPYLSNLYLIRKDEKIFSASFFFYSSLSDFLLQYGTPDEIWTSASGLESISTFGDFQLVLIYEDEGVFVSFYDYTNAGFYMDVCESSLDIGRLYITLFDPAYIKANDFLTIMEEYPQYFAIPADMVNFKEVANIDTDNFFKMFSVPDPSNCFSLMDTGYYLNPDLYNPISPAPTQIIVD